MDAKNRKQLKSAYDRINMILSDYNLAEYDNKALLMFIEAKEKIAILLKGSGIDPDRKPQKKKRKPRAIQNK